MKGLSFSQEMMVAWLAGNKTVTRRLMNPQPFDVSFSTVYPNEKELHYFIRPPSIKPRYLPGETVYIKETWMQFPGYGNIFYRATDQAEYDETSLQESYHPWKSPRFMPEWASRSHARIVSVRPEKLLSITEEEVIKEGFRDELNGNHWSPCGYFFKKTWESLHPGTWEQNPWVWRIELEKV
jgi:hypothetical protein